MYILKDRIQSNQIPKSDIIKALNSITKIAPKKGQENRSVDTAQNGIFIIFDSDKIISAYRPSDKLGKNNLEKHFKNNAVAQKKEVIKWHLESLTSIFTKI